MQKFKLYLVKGEFSEQKVLGRQSKDYLFQEFEDYEYIIVDDLNEVDKEAFPRAVISLDMPLVRAKDLDRTLVSMQKSAVSRVVFGGEGSPFGVWLDKGKDTYFVYDDAFLKLGGAKNDNMVYNTMRRRIIDHLLDGGVRILGDDFHVDSTVTVESGATLKSPLTLSGDTFVERGAYVENSIVTDSVVSKGATVTSSHITASQVGENSSVGPFARLRGANVGANCRIGDFVEVKGSTLSDGVKCAHLSYIGDADVGEKTNVGCGTVFCNYDGKNKHHTSVGKKVFIGANVNLVAPITIGDNAFLAAGTTVTKSVEDSGFIIGRVRAEKLTKPKQEG